MNKILFVLLVFIFTQTFSQEIHEANIPYYQYSPNNQLGVNEFYDVYQNPNGLIYFGSDKGLIEFNGKYFKSIQHPKRTSNSISNIRSGRENEMWMINFAGQIFQFKNNKLHLFDSSVAVNTIRFPSVAEKDNKLYIAGNLGFIEFDLKTNQKKIIENKVKDGYYWDVCILNDFAVCANANSGLIFYNTKTGKTFYKNIPAGQMNSAKLISNNDKLIFANFITNQIIEYHIIKETIYERIIFDYSKLGKLICLYEENDSTLYLSTTIGLYQINPKTKLCKSLLKGNSISKIMKDVEGNIWCTSLSNGIFVFPNTDCFVNNNINLNNGEIINSFCEITKGLVMGTNQGRLIIKQNNNKTNYFNTPGSFDIECVYFDNKSNTLFVSCGLLYKVDLNSGTFKLVNEKIRNAKSIYEHNNQLYFATSAGFYVINSLDEVKQINKLRSTKIFGDDSGIYLLSQKGLIKYNKQLNKADTLFKKISESVNCYGNLYTINFNDSIKCNQSPLKHHNLKKIKVLNDSLYTTNGNSIFYINNNNNLAEVIGPKDGMFCNRILNYYKHQNKWYVFTDNGLYQINKVKSYAKHIQLIEYNTPAPEYNYQKQNATLGVRSYPFYSSFGNYQFVYRIKDLDTNYLPFSNETEHNFKNLPSGKHIIEYGLLSNTLNKYIPGKTFQLKITPPFYQRWWFYVLIILSTLFIAYLIYRNRLIKIEIENQKKIKEQQLQADLRFSLLTALKAQMNPHFIFNALNSIQSFVLKNDKLNATAYIGKFADLMRLVLNLSSNATTKLNDEIKSLQLYLDLEAIQLDNFNYEINLDNTVDDEIQIPSLIIQPYLENAIKHGLMHKDGPKFLTINFTQNKNDILTITITDNGIGRSKSAEINKNKTHKSFSTDANQKRLDLLNHNLKTSITCEFIDLYNEQNLPAGTKVILNIPFSDESINN